MASTTVLSVSSGNESWPSVIVPIEALPQPSFRDVMRTIPVRSSRILPAWIMLGACIVLSLAMLAAFAYMIIREGFSTDVVEFIVWGPLFTFSAVTGVLILQRYPGHRVGWVMCLAGLVWITAQSSFIYGMLAFQYGDWGLPAPTHVLQIGFFYPFGLYLLLVELPLIFPTGRLAAPWWQAARVGGIAGAAGASWSVGFGTELVFFGIYGDIQNPWYRPGPISDLFNRINGFDLLFAMSVPAVMSMILRLRRATGVERMQLRWIAWVAAIVVIAYSMHKAMHQERFAERVPEEWLWLVGSIWGLALNSIAIVVGISILRLRLYDIDIVIQRTLLYGVLVALIAIAYVTVVNLVDLGARRMDADSPDPWVSSLIVAVSMALLVQPLREWLRQALNRWLFGARDDPGDILTRLGVRLEAAIAPAEVLGEVTRTVMDLLRLPHAAIAMGGAATAAVVAESGVPGSEQVGIPMVYQHERIGELRVTPRTPGEGFSRADRAVLESVARQTAVAAYALRVSGDLQLARERLVTAREEERRRLRRDLHDGLGAQLAGLTIQTGAVKRLVRPEPARAEAELDHLQDELRSAIADIRRLVHGLRPPALDEFGLVTALRSRLLAFESEGDGFSTVLVSSGDDHTLPAAVEVAIYRITEEALTNICRHAAARSATVVLDIGVAVRLEIADDGRGIAPQSRLGVGIQSMRERTEELGGTYEIGSCDGTGTRIVVTIPLPHPDVA
ncbi:MAG: sensor histidine kinase [Chloroflexota bacterium]|nr:sensor histidine kinase [Chloroflexota bacterium]